MTVIPNPHHPVSDWQTEVANGDTTLGYLAWVAEQVCADAENDDTTPGSAGRDAATRAAFDAHIAQVVNSLPNITAFTAIHALRKRFGLIGTEFSADDVTDSVVQYAEIDQRRSNGATEDTITEVVANIVAKVTSDPRWTSLDDRLAEHGNEIIADLIADHLDDALRSDNKTLGYPISENAEVTEMPSGSGWQWLVKDGNSYWGVNEDDAQVFITQTEFENDLAMSDAVTGTLS